MKLNLSDLKNFDGKDVIWVLNKTMTVVTIRIPEDQKNEIDPVFAVEKGLQGALMKWEKDTHFFSEESKDEAYELWKKNVEAGPIEITSEMPEGQDLKELIL